MKQTGWKRPLAFPLVLRDGRRIETLEQAVALIAEVPPERLELDRWKYALELIEEAHKTGNADDISLATGQLARALQREGWMI